MCIIALLFIIPHAVHRRSDRSLTARIFLQPAINAAVPRASASPPTLTTSVAHVLPWVSVSTLSAFHGRLHPHRPLACTYLGPSHKRGPPKGYILALERRLHQVEALLGTIIGSDDARARTLIDDLSRDQLAAHIVRRVKTGPFGPRGRLTQPYVHMHFSSSTCSVTDS